MSDAAAAQRLTGRKKIGETGICACLSSTAVVKPLTEYVQVTVLWALLQRAQESDEMHRPPFSLLLYCHRALIAGSYFPSCG